MKIAIFVITLFVLATSAYFVYVKEYHNAVFCFGLFLMSLIAYKYIIFK